MVYQYYCITVVRALRADGSSDYERKARLAAVAAYAAIALPPALWLVARRTETTVGKRE
jgi:hypothetical protein